MTEMALVSVRKARLKQRAEEGDSRAERALELTDNPTQFLSTVQVGITLVGIIAGVFAGATLALELGRHLAEVPLIGPWAEEVSFAIVVILITFLSLVFGELIPKRIGMYFSEAIAMAFSGWMQWLSRAASPLIWLLSRCTDAIITLIGIPSQPTSPVTHEELNVILEEGAQAGIIEHEEKSMVQRVLSLDERHVVTTMTPREDVVWLNLDDSPEHVWNILLTSGHSYLPVCEGSFDNIRGLVSIKDFLDVEKERIFEEIREKLREPLFVPDTTTLMRVVEIFKENGQHIALVVDEHGVFEGVITLIDVLEGIVGAIPSAEHEQVQEDPPVVKRDENSWYIDGRYPLVELEKLLALDSLPEGAKDNYHTLAGFVMYTLGAVPITGTAFNFDRYRFEVVDMDGRRIDKVLVSVNPEVSEDA